MLLAKMELKEVGLISQLKQWKKQKYILNNGLKILDLWKWKTVISEREQKCLASPSCHLCLSLLPRDNFQTKVEKQRNQSRPDHLPKLKWQNLVYEVAKIVRICMAEYWKWSKCMERISEIYRRCQVYQLSTDKLICVGKLTRAGKITIERIRCNP